MHAACKTTLLVILSLSLLSCAGVDKESQTAQPQPEALPGKESDLRRAADYVATLANPHDSGLGALSLASKIEDEGLLKGLKTEVAASVPDGRDFPNIELEQPTTPWTLLLKESADSTHVVVEGYGDDLSKPLFSELITVLDGRDVQSVIRPR